jgi:hypothetical protein
MLLIASGNPGEPRSVEAGPCGSAHDRSSVIAKKSWNKRAIHEKCAKLQVNDTHAK